MRDLFDVSVRVRTLVPALHDVQFVCAIYLSVCLFSLNPGGAHAPEHLLC